MYISRKTSIIIHQILDHWLPPIIRDSKWCMYPLFWIVFGSQARTFMGFKDRVAYRDSKGMKQIYENTASVHIQRQTDLTPECVEKIEQCILGGSVLDIACGRGYLSGRLSPLYQVVAADMHIETQTVYRHSLVSFVQSSITDLPFADGAFDTVVCAHTLEHITDIQKAVQELRRVTKKRLIIVVPKQRPYRYTFDLHVHFFPYAWSLELLLKKTEVSSRCELVGGDWLYVDDGRFAISLGIGPCFDSLSPCQ